MPSMSYCAFENTTIEIWQLISMLKEAVDDMEPIKFNEHENYYFTRMSGLIEKLQNAIGDYNRAFPKFEEK